MHESPDIAADHEAERLNSFARVVRTWIAIGSLALIVGLGTLFLAEDEVEPTADPPVGLGFISDGAEPRLPDPDDESPGRVLDIIIVDAEKDQDVAILSDGAVIPRGDLPDQVAIRVDTSPAEVGSVAFEFDNARTVEDTAPYAVSGDVTGSGDFLPLFVDIGTHSLTVTPWNEGSGEGLPGEDLAVSFEIVPGDSSGRNRSLFDTLAPWIIVTALLIALLSALTALRTAGRMRSLREADRNLD